MYGREKKDKVFQSIRISGADRPEYKNLATYITLCDNCNFSYISPEDFEKLVGIVFEKWGYSVVQTSHTGDEGIDLICNRKYSPDIVVVQCKRYKGKVGPHIVRDFYGAMIHNKAAKGYIVTTGHFTSGAIDWARDKPIELVDRDRLITCLTE